MLGTVLKYVHGQIDACHMLSHKHTARITEQGISCSQTRKGNHSPGHILNTFLPKPKDEQMRRTRYLFANARVLVVIFLLRTLQIFRNAQ